MHWRTLMDRLVTNAASLKCDNCILGAFEVGGNRMTESQKRGPIGRAGELQEIVDGTLCRKESPIPGPLRFTPLAPYQAIYCHAWSPAQRQAFWKGFLVRVDEIGEDLDALLDWLSDAFGIGDEEGDFSKAWEAFGEGLSGVTELVGKLLVVAGIPVVLRLHPKREQYEKELKELGIVLTRTMTEGYQNAYNEGGLPQCTGRLLADIVALAVEFATTKGAGKVVKATKITSKLPEKLKGAAESLKKGLGKVDTTALMRRAKVVKLNTNGRPVALFSFGRKEKNIPQQFATLNRMLEETSEGKRLLKTLESLPWNQQEAIWWELSDRVAKLGANSGKQVHVFVSKQYRDRMFPDPKVVQQWWTRHKEELIEIRNKKLKQDNLSGAEFQDEVAKYQKKLDNWSQDEIEAQHYAIKGKHAISGKYEDEVFLKIEKMNISDVWIHVVDDAGNETDRFWHKL